ncbi:MAG: hypothetical protein RIR36_1479 [Bacteroidota bacterium]|jgi:cytochrome c2
MNKLISILIGILLMSACSIEKKEVAPELTAVVDTAVALKNTYNELQSKYKYTGTMTGYKLNVVYTQTMSNFYIVNSSKDYIANGTIDSLGIEVKVSRADSIKFLNEFKLHEYPNKLDSTIVAYSYSIVTTQGRYTVYLEPKTLKLLSNTVTYPGDQFYKPLDFYLAKGVFSEDFYR